MYRGQSCNEDKIFCSGGGRSSRTTHALCAACRRQGRGRRCVTTACRCACSLVGRQSSSFLQAGCKARQERSWLLGHKMPSDSAANRAV